jgi:Skp family chaperone for outer membrane proteins
MWNRKFGIGVAAVAVATTLLAAATGYGGPASDKGKNNDGATVGFVDLNQVSDEVKKTPSWQKMVQRSTEARQRFSTELDDMVARRHLTEAEVKELQTLQTKPKASDAERERISVLLRKSDDIDKEFNDLAQIQDLKTEQSARLQLLSKMRAEAGARLQQARGEREQKLADMENEMLTDLQGKILKVVAEVAKGQGVEIVVDKQALLYGGRDLTSTVIQKMPKS